MTTIIIAALAIIVLVILIAIFTGKIGNFGTDVEGSIGEFKGKCELPGTTRKCALTYQCNSTFGGRKVGSDGGYDCGTNWVCCEY